ncbi:MAG: TonB family protein [Devosia sp.]|uniref:energy transducer TonB family protein n=1 Tax=Devosia sp. TaxID=1871048 RepID=UPI0024C51855|nr:energy transducer TonB [Devosia sp.]UYN99613.1 MAG: TonB family protein [Devosia sp.]
MAPEPPSAAALLTNPQVSSPEAAIASAPPGVPLPMPRPVRPDEIAPPPKAVPLPMAPSPQLQASRTATPATVHQRPSTPPPSPAASPAAATAPTASATAAPAREAAPQVSASAEQAWQGRVIAHLYRRRDYPASAQRSRLQGTATLRFRIDASGRVLSAQIARSSGHGVLDEAVMSMIARASPVPAPPQGLAGDKLTLVVPIEFALR